MRGFDFFTEVVYCACIKCSIACFFEFAYWQLFQTYDKIKVPLLHTFFTSIIIEQYIENKQTQNYENTKALSIKLFEESYKQIKNNFDNAKFVILYIECPLDGENIHLNYIKEFATNTNNNIVLINANEHIQDLKTNKKYWLNDDSHPSALFWDTIIPILSKELKL